MVKSMFAAVAGLRAHQSKMDVIGNNIANVNTYAYKKQRATFRDQFYATMRGASDSGNVWGGGNPSQLGYGSQVSGIDVNHGRGGMASTGIGMDVLISGNGFFLVGRKNDDGYATTSRWDGGGMTVQDLTMTRVGIFNIDGAGYMVDTNMNFVYGIYEQRAMMPDVERDANGKTVYILGADGEPETDDDGNPVAMPKLLYKLDADGQRIPLEPPEDLEITVNGEDYTIEIEYELLWADEDETIPRFEMVPDPNAESVKRLELIQIPYIVMKADGSPLLDENGDYIEIPYLRDDEGRYITVNGERVRDESRMPQQARDPSADPIVWDPIEGYYYDQMKLYSISIGSDGKVIGQTETGKVVTFGQVAVANVPNPNALEMQGDGYYRAMANTGTITAEIPGEGSTGVLVSGYLEMANVDLAEEFTDMITTQRGFQANTRIITVTDEMLHELVNLKR